MVSKSRHFDPDARPKVGGKLPLWDYARARSTDPSTSGEAARRMNKSGAASRHEQEILAVLRVRDGLTPQEISGRCGLSFVQVSRRIKGMQEKGFAYREGTRVVMRDDQQSTQQVVYITEAGRGA